VQEYVGCKRHAPAAKSTGIIIIIIIIIITIIVTDVVIAEVYNTSNNINSNGKQAV
jgi:flagellar basal body-associated protein FliL